MSRPPPAVSAVNVGMQRYTSHTVTDNNSSTTHWPAAAAAPDAFRTPAGDISQVMSSSAWASSPGRHSGTLKFTVLYDTTILVSPFVVMSQQVM